MKHDLLSEKTGRLSEIKVKIERLTSGFPETKIFQEDKNRYTFL